MKEFSSMHKFAEKLRKTVHVRSEKITTTRVKDTQELEANTPKEKQEKFLAKSREVWRQFTVHGISIVDKFSGKQKLLNRTDLDGAASLGILKMAGFDTSNVKYVKAGESMDGRIMVDTGYESGLVVEDNGTAFFDHHGKDSNQASISAAKVVYRVLVEAGFLERTPALDALTKFITQVDNQTHPDLKTREFWENSDKTILGLYRFMDFDHLLQFFQDGHLATDSLGDADLMKYSPALKIIKDPAGKVQLRPVGGPEEEELKKIDQFNIQHKEESKDVELKLEYKLLKARVEQRRNIDQSKIKLQELERDGFVVNTKHGRIVIDIGKKLQGGQLATRAYGYDGYLVYNPEVDSFFLGINRGKLDFDPPQGVIVRDTMWIKPADKEPLRAVLKDIINVVGPAEGARPSGKLKEFVEQNERVDVVTPQPPKPGEMNWTVSGLDKFGILPRDFRPEPGRRYQVMVAKDTNPGGPSGVYLLKVIRPA